jgi:rhodanese-related sulfurtransferase
VTTRTRLAALALAALAPLAACSSGDDGTSAAETQPAAASQPAAGAEAPGVVLVSAEQAQAVLQAQPEAVTLDVRTPEEFATGHLAGASLLDFNSGEFAARLGELPTDATYVLYCRSGNRSAQAAAMMREAGFREVYEVDGGIQAWQAAGLPVES